MVRCNEISEFLETQFVVAVRVEPTNDLNKFLLHSINTVAPQESTQVANSNDSIRVLVNGVECMVRIVVVSCV